MSNILMCGNEPLGQVSDLTADNIEYSEGVSVKQKIDGMIESGSNANGSWIKYADGTMICTKTVNAGNRLFANAWGSLYEATEGIDFGDWAMEFYAKPAVSLCLANAGGACFFGNLNNSSNTYIGACGLSRPNQATIPVVVDVIGIGRWKA